MRRLIFFVLVLVLGGCDGIVVPPPDEPPAPNLVELRSQRGDWVGAGVSYSYTGREAIISVLSDRNLVYVNIEGDEWWTGNFQGPDAEARLRPGAYANLSRWPFHDPAVGGVSWTGMGRGCNEVRGSFTVDSVRYVGTRLAAISLSFEQRCDGNPALLEGRIRWREDDPTSVPGPVTPIPGSLWKPAPGTVPAAGSYVHLSSDPGEYIGAGRSYSYTADAMRTSTSGGRFSITTTGPELWLGDFKAMDGLSRLEPGYYPNLRRYPFHNPARGGLSWVGEGRGCNQLEGWFAVDEVAYTDGRLTAIALRFEQRCDGDPRALRGAVRWEEGDGNFKL
jgi:hypothetical protein